MNLLRRGILGLANIPVDINSLFSVALYTGNLSNVLVTNNLDMTTGNYLMWAKSRSVAQSHYLTNSVTGTTKFQVSDTTASEATDTNGINTPTATGFSIGNSTFANTNLTTYAATVFKEAAGFFDIVEYVGDGLASQAIPHSLGVQAGLVIIKNKATANWTVQHVDSGTASGSLNNTNTFTTKGYTPSALDANNFYVGSANVDANASGNNYIAYVFAHNPINSIACGKYTGNGVSGLQVTTGFLPQYTLIKSLDTVSGRWFIHDNVRGATNLLAANSPNSEQSFAPLSYNATGFSVDSTHSEINTSGANYMYMTIGQ